MSDYTPTPKLPDFFAPIPMSGALTYTPTTEEVRADYCLLADVSRPRQMQFDRWLAEVIRKAKNDAWFEGFSAGWDECDDPDGFVNDKWDAKTPNPYRKEENND